jgi:hypothetical protein
MLPAEIAEMGKMFYPFPPDKAEVEYTNFEK